MKRDVPELDERPSWKESEVRFEPAQPEEVEILKAQKPIVLNPLEEALKGLSV